jgi:aminoglycoside 6'-N-acetyltransferase I
MKIIPFDPAQNHLIQQAAQLLMDGFKEHWPDAWPTLEDALEEVQEMLSADRILRVAIDEQGNLVGLIGGIPQYDGLVWELHPLVVKTGMQFKGVGSALVRDFEEQVRARGALTIVLGSDDEDDQTSLSNADLYNDLWKQIREIRNFKQHPYEFYQKMGYVISGVVPDANGIGKPDILMAKRL